ncbi:MAG: excinuclease ABC subunit C, partial [Clostridiales bacterium]|jgi:excinuclease ABC subunit C|nr:excinuclease ABC subunit C [Clostridiales bacterium]
LGLAAPIFRIEAYDISNIQGFENVGSMVVFEGGRARRSDYRKFKIKSLDSGEANDYQAMQEVLHRRFKRYQNEEKGGFSRLPDIIFVDGGSGHISAAKEVLEYMNIDIPICGMVKDSKHRTRALLFDGREVTMPLTGEGFRLVTRIQEEVHRFAIEYHRKLRQKTATKSVLDDIPGIGPARRKALMLRFGTIEAIRAADIDELSGTAGMTKAAAKAVRGFFEGKQ